MQANSLEKTNVLSVASHASIFVSVLLVSIGVPIAILFISDNLVVKDNAKEAINFHLNIWVIGFVIAVLSFLTFGLLGLILGPLLFLYTCGMSVWAILHCLKDSEKPFRYPFIFRLI